MILKGQDFRIKVGGYVVACSTSCTCHGSAQVEEASHKDLTGKWSKPETVMLSWDCSVDALVYVQDATGTTYDGKTVQDLWDLLGQEVDIDFVEKGSTIRRSGKAILNDISETHANKANSTFSAQFTGVGQLAKGKPGTGDAGGPVA